VSPHPKARPAEDAAEQFLRQAGLKVAQRNFATPFGEIDLIAVDGDTVVFVEVKSRATDAFGPPQDGVTRTKQAHLRRAAEIYLKRRGLLDRVPCRFDVLALTGTAEEGWAIQHFVDAF
jgi:putative endonuclease